MFVIFFFLIIIGNLKKNFKFHNLNFSSHGRQGYTGNNTSSKNEILKSKDPSPAIAPPQLQLLVYPLTLLFSLANLLFRYFHFFHNYLSPFPNPEFVLKHDLRTFVGVIKYLSTSYPNNLSSDIFSFIG